MLQYLILVLTGVLGGFVAGFIGVGGGIIYVLVLPYIFESYDIQDNQLAAVIVANSLFGIFLSSLISVITHLKHKTFYFKETLYTSIPAVISSVLCLTLFVTGEHYDYQYFNIFIVFLILIILINFFIRRNQTLNRDKPKYQNVKLSFSGALAGLVSALSGLGGSIVLIPLLRNLLSFEMLKVKSIALGMILMITSIMSAINMSETDVNASFYGLINFEVVLPIAIGVIFSSIYGVNVSHRVSGKVIERTFIAFLLIVLLNKAYLIF